MAEVPSVPHMNPASWRTIAVIAAVALALLSVAAYYYSRQSPTPPPPSIATPLPPPPAQSLGAELYEKAANPVAEQLPETLTPVPNPIEDLYRNPFQ